LSALDQMERVRALLAAGAPCGGFDRATLIRWERAGASRTVVAGLTVHCPEPLGDRLWSVPLDTLRVLMSEGLIEIAEWSEPGAQVVEQRARDITPEQIAAESARQERQRELSAAENALAAQQAAEIQGTLGGAFGEVIGEGVRGVMGNVLGLGAGILGINPRTLKIVLYVGATGVVGVVGLRIYKAVRTVKRVVAG